MYCKLIVTIIVPLAIACNSQPRTDSYFAFPVQEILLPELERPVVMTPLPECFSGFSSFWIEDNLFLGSLDMDPYDILMSADLSSCTETGRFGKRGRGPLEFLSPVSFDLNDGHMLVFDIMTTRVSDIDVEESIRNGSSVIKNVCQLETGEYAYLPLATIHQWENGLLAFDTGNDPMSHDLYNVPDYVEYNLCTGEKVKEYELFKSIPLSNKKKEHEYVEVKSRLALTDCVLPGKSGICFAMKFIPQINIFNPSTGECRGYRISDLSVNSLKPAYLHYNSVCTNGSDIFAIYVGAQESIANNAQITTELHQFDIDGRFMHRIPLDGAFIDCRASESGLYLSKAINGGKDVGLYRIEWDTFAHY